MGGKATLERCERKEVILVLKRAYGLGGVSVLERFLSSIDTHLTWQIEQRGARLLDSVL